MQMLESGMKKKSFVNNIWAFPQEMVAYQALKMSYLEIYVDATPSESSPGDSHGHGNQKKRTDR